MALNEHAKDKIKRLLGNRINPETEEVTLVTDRCPLRKQNYDYNQYLLLALFYESSVSILSLIIDSVQYLILKF